MRRTLKVISLTGTLLMSLAKPLLAEQAAPVVNETAQPGAAQAAADDAVCGLSAESATKLIIMVEELKLPEMPAPDGFRAWQDNTNRMSWTVTTPSHPAHPSAVCRKVVQDQLRADVLMELRCDGEQSQCDELVGQFRVMTDQMRRNVRIQY
jgi:hypothetical protein